MKTTNILHVDLPRSSNCMTTSGESQKETTGMKLEVMSAKTKTRIGFLECTYHVRNWEACTGYNRNEMV